MKIFCIGLSRTGTTSLTKALEILGYKTKHFPDLFSFGGYFWGIEWSELYRYDAFSDLPVARFYKSLDKKFPGSKFILSEREIESWLASCSNFNRLVNRPKRNIYRITRLRKEIYGTDYFVSELFRQSYLRHTADVKQYFADRGNDILYLNIIKGDGWEKLCKFLDKDIPDITFPHKNEGSKAIDSVEFTSIR